MSNEKKAVVSALLRGVTSQSLIDAMFASARPGTLQSPPSDAVALKFYKGDLDHVLAIAGDTRTSPAVLEKFAGDTRVSVRETLISNPSTPVSAMERLARWAAGRDEQSVIAKALGRLEPEQVITILESIPQGGYRTHNSPVAVVVTRKVRGNADLTRRAMKLGPADIAVSVVRDVAQGKNTALTAVDAYEAASAAGHGSTVYSLLEGVSELTVDLATMVATASLATHRSVVGQTEKVTLIEPGSLDALVKGSDECFTHAVLLGVSEETLRGMVASMTPSQISIVVSSLRERKYSAGFENELVKAAVRHGAEAFCEGRVEIDGGFASILTGLQHRLPEDTLMALLRSFGWAVTQTWLVAKPGLVNYPRSGQLDRLGKNLGNAFSNVRMTRVRDARGYLVNQMAVDQVTLENQVAGVFMSRDVAEDPRPGALTNSEIARYFDEPIGTHLSWDYIGRFAASRLELALGDQLDAWETALTLAPGWTSGLEDLITATLSLSGAERIDTAPEVVLHDDVREVFVQDDLVCV